MTVVAETRQQNRGSEPAPIPAPRSSQDRACGRAVWTRLVQPPAGGGKTPRPPPARGRRTPARRSRSRVPGAPGRPLPPSRETLHRATLSAPRGPAPRSEPPGALRGAAPPPPPARRPLTPAKPRLPHGALPRMSVPAVSAPRAQGPGHRAGASPLAGRPLPLAFPTRTRPPSPPHYIASGRGRDVASRRPTSPAQPIPGASRLKGRNRGGGARVGSGGARVGSASVARPRQCRAAPLGRSLCLPRAVFLGRRGLGASPLPDPGGRCPAPRTPSRESFSEVCGPPGLGRGSCPTQRRHRASRGVSTVSSPREGFVFPCPRAAAAWVG